MVITYILYVVLFKDIVNLTLLFAILQFIERKSMLLIIT